MTNIQVEADIKIVCDDCIKEAQYAQCEAHNSEIADEAYKEGFAAGKAAAEKDA